MNCNMWMGDVEIGKLREAGGGGGIGGWLSNNLHQTINKFGNIEIINKQFGFSNQFNLLNEIKFHLKRPFDLLIDSDILYVADSGNRRICLFDLEGNYKKVFIDHIPAPTCIILDETDNTILIGGKGVIYRYSKDSYLLDKYVNNNLEYIFGLAVDTSVNGYGDIYICDHNNSRILVISKKSCYHALKVFNKTDGKFIKTLVGSHKKGNLENEFDFVKGFHFDKINKQYIVCDSGNNRLQLFKEDGEFINSFSGSDDMLEDNDFQIRCE
ncbi:hypothetical protein ABK040_007712 [Willaertia magna]